MFGAKRKARKIGQDEEDEGGDLTMLGGIGGGEGKSSLVFQSAATVSLTANSRRLTAFLGHMPAVVRPSSTPSSNLKSKRKATTRTSFGLTGTSMTEDNDDEENTGAAVVIPKRSGLSRQALEKSTARKSLAASIHSASIPLRQTEDRPSYSADALSELRSSTPTLPKDIKYRTDITDIEHNVAGDVQSRKELDLAAKFGSHLGYTLDAAIPTDAEIREKKERRARLAKEHEYISLNDDDDDGEERDQQQDQQAGVDSDDDFKDRSILQRYAEQSKPSKYEETRLVRDDEDIAEGFDDFVEDGRIALGRNARKEQKKRHAAEMREAIARAEGSNDDSSEDESEAERNAAYEAAQTRAGMDGLRKEEKGARARRPRTPPKITPLPSLAGCAERMKGELERRRALIAQRSMRLEEVRQELADIALRKIEVQRFLDEAGERYQRLRVEAGNIKMEENLGREVLAHERSELAHPGEVKSNEESMADWDDGPKPMGLGMGT